MPVSGHGSIQPCQYQVVPVSGYASVRLGAGVACAGGSPGACCVPWPGASVWRGTLFRGVCWCKRGAWDLIVCSVASACAGVGCETSLRVPWRLLVQAWGVGTDCLSLDSSCINPQSRRKLENILIQSQIPFNAIQGKEIWNGLPESGSSHADSSHCNSIQRHVERIA